MEHYLDFLALLQEGLQQQVGVLVKNSLGDLTDEVWFPLATPELQVSVSSLRCEGNEVGHF